MKRALMCMIDLPKDIWKVQHRFLSTSAKLLPSFSKEKLANESVLAIARKVKKDKRSKMTRVCWELALWFSLRRSNDIEANWSLLFHINTIRQQLDARLFPGDLIDTAVPDVIISALSQLRRYPKYLLSYTLCVKSSWCELQKQISILARIGGTPKGWKR